MRDADACGQQLVFCNSYHLLLHPGPEIIEGTFSILESSVLYKEKYSILACHCGTVTYTFDKTKKN